MKPFENNRTLFLSIFIIVAVLIAIGSLFVSHYLVRDLSQEEHNKIQIWAEATKELASSSESANMNLIVQILESNTTIPVIHYDEKDDFYASSNIHLPVESEQQNFLREQARLFEKKNGPIEIQLDDSKQYVYYDDSHTLKRLQLYPYVQLGILTVVIIIAFFALFSTMRREQDRVWVGLSKETAHQLGTPISSLMAWVEFLRLKDTDPAILNDMVKDIGRLEIITDRFSKIGSTPALERCDAGYVVEQAVAYLSKRISKQVTLNINIPKDAVYAQVSESLFGWVIENVTKNAVDAMTGQGTITYTLFAKGNMVYIDIEDTGKGIPKSKFNAIFLPGYTTKSRGWGLGLSLTKRIIESFHKGKIYVHWSELNKGTVLRIELRKIN